MEDSVFTKIINGELPAYFVYKHEKVVAFLPQELVSHGHILVVPRVQLDHIWDLPDEEYQHLVGVVKKLGGSLRDWSTEARVIEVVEGFEVPHVHVHLIPASVGMEKLATTPKLQLSPEEKTILATELSEVCN